MARRSLINDSLARFSGVQRHALQATVDSLRELLPAASEAISWNMPTLVIDGIGVAAVEGFKHHNSMFPMSGSIPTRLAAELAGYKVSKGTIQFPIDRPIPKSLLRKIVKARIEEINASFPKKNGEFKEFYSNGALKAMGKVKSDQMHGAWRWYRRDGSLMRTGSFVLGVQTGEWATYGADGRLVKRTDFGKARATR